MIRHLTYIHENDTIFSLGTHTFFKAYLSRKITMFPARVSKRICWQCQFHWINILILKIKPPNVQKIKNYFVSYKFSSKNYLIHDFRMLATFIFYYLFFLSFVQLFLAFFTKETYFEILQFFSFQKKKSLFFGRAKWYPYECLAIIRYFFTFFIVICVQKLYSI